MEGIDPVSIYRQKINTINNRVNARFAAVGIDTGFSGILQSVRDTENVNKTNKASQTDENERLAGIKKAIKHLGVSNGGNTASSITGVLASELGGGINDELKDAMTELGLSSDILGLSSSNALLDALSGDFGTQSMTNGIMSYALTNMLANKLAADNTGTSGTYNAYSGSGIFRMSNINPNAEVGKRTEYEYLIGKAAEKYGVNETLIKAIMKAESDFDPECVSKAGAVGLMQLMPETAKVMGVTNSYDEEQNINGGVGYFKKQLDAYGGDVKMALAAYNCGPTRLRNLGITSLEDPADFAKLPAETRNYVNKIINSIK